eukprot:7102264-Pyramimonas_sp.AAC.1
MEEVLDRVVHVEGASPGEESLVDDEIGTVGNDGTAEGLDQGGQRRTGVSNFSEITKFLQVTDGQGPEAVPTSKFQERDRLADGQESDAQLPERVRRLRRSSRKIQCLRRAAEQAPSWSTAAQGANYEKAGATERALWLGE